MKFLAALSTLVFLCSCNQTPTTVAESKESASKQVVKKEAPFALPQINFMRSVTLDYDQEFLYEDLSVNSNSNKPVLGDRFFYANLHSENNVELRFYEKTQIKQVSYLDLGNSFGKVNIKGINKDILLNSSLKKMDKFFRSLTWGRVDFDLPEQDMFNKVYIIETEAEADGYKSDSKMMVWIECLEGLGLQGRHSYTCGKEKLKLNFKLLDYKLLKQ